MVIEERVELGRHNPSGAPVGRLARYLSVAELAGWAQAPNRPDRTVQSGAPDLGFLAGLGLFGFRLEHQVGRDARWTLRGVTPFSLEGARASSVKPDRYCRVMSDVQPSLGKLWNYRFSQSDGTEVETGEFENDESAETRAREISTSNEAPVVIHRHSGHVDAWEYVTEVDERP